MKKTIFILLTSIAATSSCKKEYICECSNPGGKVKAFTTNSTKQKAKQKCKAYYNENFGNVPVSETSCEIK